MVDSHSTPKHPVAGLLIVGQLVRDIMALAGTLNDQTKIILLPEGLTPAQREVLVALRRHGRMTMASMAREQGFSRQNARILVNALVKRGFLKRGNNPEHKRAPLVEITPEGLATLQSILHREGTVLSCLAGAIDADEARAAQAALAKVTAALTRILHE